MNNAALITALQNLITAIQAQESAASAAGDNASAAALMSAMANLTNALMILGAKNIVAALPSDATGNQIKAAMAKINQATTDITNGVKSINEAVNIASTVVTLVGQVSAGSFATAAGTAAHLIGIV